jgi:signal transduction histidine kinase
VTTRTATRLAIALTLVFVAIEGLGLALQFATGIPENEAFGLPGQVVQGFIYLACSVIGCLIVSRHPRNAVGWILSALALVGAIEGLAFGYATYAIFTHPGSLPAGAFAGITYANSSQIALLLLVLLFLLFPDGRALSRRWNIVVWIAIASTGILVLGNYLVAGTIDRFGIRNPYAVIPRSGPQVLGAMVAFLMLGALVASVVALVVRLRRARGDERQQMRWFVFAAAFLPAAIIFFTVFNAEGTGVIGASRGTVDVITSILLAIGVIGIPVSAGIAIFKYRLYDIDIVIGKTVVVGVLAAFATVVYIAIVVGVGTIVGSHGGQPSVLLAVVATAIVGIAFQPVRQWAQRLANRVVYGEKATPYDVLSDFSGRMAGTFALQDLLPRMAQMLAEGTGALRADVWLRRGDRLRPAGSWPADASPFDSVASSGTDLPEMDGVDIAVPVRYQGDLLGALTVSKKPGDPPTPIEQRLVADMGSQAGLVLSNVRLIEDLRASRQRLVVAQDHERRKLERDLHDGAQQQLVALAVKQRLAEELIDRDPERAHTMLTEAQADTTDAIQTIRDLARGIYPPLLADQGLAAALNAQVRRAAIPVEVHADGIERYGQDIEAAVYFCSLEALQNVTKYAEASGAAVELSETDGWLSFAVSDDGAGFDPSAVARGTGLLGMADRVEALGGSLDVGSRPGKGTTVTGRIPIPAAG